jgi:molybdate transport system substrate-binding protein
MPDLMPRRPSRLSAWCIVLALALWPAWPGPDATAQGRRLVRIAAASDLRFAMDELVTRLGAAQPALDVRVTYGSSGTFFAQLVNGAPFDVFLSADVDYPRQLAARGLTVEGSEFIYGVGHLVVWVPAASPLDIDRTGVSVLLDPRVQHVAIANPATAPYGRAAEAALRGLGLYDRVAGKLVLGDNVAQTLQFVQSGSAEAGVVALSLALAPATRASGRFVNVPLEAYPRMEQAGTILRTAADLEAARLVRAFLLGDAARGILRQYGFALSD